MKSEARGAQNEFRSAQPGFFRAACSNGPVGRLRSARSSTKMDRAQPGGYRIYEIAWSIRPARCLEKEPSSSLCFIDPNFDQTRRGDVAVFLTHVVGLAETRGQGFVVLC